MKYKPLFINICTIFLLLLGCKEKLYAPATPNENESGYIQISQMSNFCGVDWYNSNNVNIDVDVLVKDNSGNFITHWKNYPQSIIKTNLVQNPNSTGSSPFDCIFVNIPGRMKYIVKIRIRTDCCNSCPPCTYLDNNGNQITYYGKQLFFGETTPLSYGDPGPGYKYVEKCPLQIDSKNQCESFKDCL